MSRRRGAKQAGRWLYPSTRWAIYLRDGLACTYCGVTMEECLKYQDNFLTVDHVVPKAPLKGGRRGGHEVTNLVTACYGCNSDKGRSTLTAWARSRGDAPDMLWSRVRRRTSRPIEEYRLAAKMMLGTSGIPGFSQLSELVYDHDWLCKRQWGDESVEGAYWEHIQEQGRLWCESCSRPMPEAQPTKEPCAGCDSLCPWCEPGFRP